MPPLAFSTLACPDWSLAEVVERCREYGYDGVEVRQIAGQTDLLQVGELAASRHADLRRTLGQAGVSICGLASSVRFDYPEAAARAEQLRTGQAYVELAASLGARFVRVFGDVLPPGEFQGHGRSQPRRDRGGTQPSGRVCRRSRTASTFCWRRTEILRNPRSSAS